MLSCFLEFFNSQAIVILCIENIYYSNLWWLLIFFEYSPNFWFNNIWVSLVTALYFIHPIFVKEILEINSTNNETKVIKPLPLSSWFPYDEQKYYIKSYCWQILDGCVGSSFVGYSDIFTFSLIIYPLGQIKILKHILSNFQHYAAKVKIQIKCSKELSSFITLRQCIRLHMVTIRYTIENRNIYSKIHHSFLSDTLKNSTKPWKI